ncbi:MAG: ATP-dependent helicase HrpB, partial [Sphingomonadaceae bacterium]
TAPTELPVAAALAALRQALAQGPNAVLVAPPGAGKTTLVPGALLGEPWAEGGRLLVMLPRRLAARAAAERIAALVGGEVGRDVGYVTRLETATSPQARIECLTEGVFVARLLAEPDLPGVAGLLFDEVHERNLEGDLGLALALDAQGAFRPDLRILAMSATVDGAAFARLMGGAPVIEAPGRANPLELRYRPPRPGEPLEAAVARAVAEALQACCGSVLVFLPGVAEIARAARALGEPPGARVLPLHGSLSPLAQRRVLDPSFEPSLRKVILATSIAESSLTIEGVRAVVDSGLARRPRYDPGTGLTRLETGRASQASATQRAGRAARQGPGLAIRLWAEGETRGRIPFEPPEILAADLSSLVLTCARWGLPPERLAMLDQPPAAALADARQRLAGLGALDPAGAITATGRQIAAVPLAPALAAMLCQAARAGEARMGARIAVLLSERGAGGDATDLAGRLAALARDGPARLLRLAERWAQQAERLQPAEHAASRPEAATLLATAFPDRVARRRRAPGARDAEVSYLMAGGRAAVIASTDPLATREWLVVADATGSGPDARIRLAADFTDGIGAWADRHATRQAEVRIEGDRVVAQETRMLGAIRLGSAPLAEPDPQLVGRAIAAHLLARPLPLPEAEARMCARLRAAVAHGFEGLPALDDAALVAALLARAGRVRRLSDLPWEGLFASLVPPGLAPLLDRFAPAHLATPAGVRAAIAYDADAGPEAEVRVQALFGLDRHPRVLGDVPLTLALTSPAGRVIARTRDLPGFWRGAWADVRRDLKGRYPKHDWPEDPLTAIATLRSKAAAARA